MAESFLASRCESAHVRVGGAQIFVRIYRCVVNTDFVVQVRAGTAASVANVADGIAAMNVFTSEYRYALHMSIACCNAVTVIKDNRPSVSAHEICKHHDCVCRRDDLLSDRRSNVNSRMERALTVKWIDAFAKSSSDCTFHWPDIRRGIGPHPV